eukprot:3370108-Rhodomonas_salina.2
MKSVRKDALTPTMPWAKLYPFICCAVLRPEPRCGLIDTALVERPEPQCDLIDTALAEHQYDLIDTALVERPEPRRDLVDTALVVGPEPRYTAYAHTSHLQL